MKSAIALLLLQVCLSSLAMAQNLTPVVDLSNPMPATTATDSSIVASTAAVSASSDQYYQMQVLQEEVQMLRGLVEELNYELQQIKQRQIKQQPMQPQVKTLMVTAFAKERMRAPSQQRLQPRAKAVRTI